MAREDYLFTGADWLLIERNQRQAMADEIEKIDSDRLLNTSVDDLIVYFSQKYGIEVPVLDEEGLVVDERETQIDISRDHNRHVLDRSRPCYITGSAIEVEVPFTGEAEAFRIKPNPYNLSPPRACIRGNLLTFTISGAQLVADQVRGQIDRTLQDIHSNLENLRANVEGLNRQLPRSARLAIEARREKLLANRSTVAALGFKMKERQNAPKTYLPAEVRKKISPTMPRASSNPYRPEPALGEADYEHILGVMQSMTQVMELSPSAFCDVDEETLRSHFLVQLNGHYQGQATGETFNYEGKTDILIRSDGRNIFIAECKFWSGPKKLSTTIDQLLGYSSWRDTKTAIVVFNRNRDFSKVLESIPEAVSAHPHYKKTLSGSSETVFRYLFANRDDRNRELYLTVMAFDVPTPRA
ncbi:hypothetical protein ACCP91_19305 [Xanthomonas axonopodis pv. cyamopsidis]|uniref:hypothetical protein n=1 Tax=Xanthomonas TaxID=338 RepID=UPI001ABFBB72|nr:hypothetical protein [Xanthomonas euvesicatoria]